MQTKKLREEVEK